MKKILIAFALLPFFCTLSKGQSTLQVHIQNCKNQLRWARLSEFKVFRNGVLAKTVEPENLKSTMLTNLEYGEYRIEYKTLFEKNESVFIELSEKKKYSIVLCLDYMDHDSEPYKPFIDQLKNGEEYTIQIVSQGCFHSSDELITVKRTSNKYYVTFNGAEQPLSTDQIWAIRHFEIELNYMESSGCTTTATYLVKFKDQEVHISDGSCSWFGASFLKKALNLTDE